MKVWQAVSFNEVDQLLEIARCAEASGFEGVFVSDHIVVPEKVEPKYPYSEDGVAGFTSATPFPEPWATISAMAAVTTRLRFTTLVYIMPLRHPLDVANSVATAAVLSNNRVALGAGAGWMREEFEIMGASFTKRGRRFNEMIEIVRKAWTGEVVEHHGEFYDFPRLQLSPAPSAPVPILIGGISEPALRRAATLGDGWLGAGHTLDEAAGLLGRLRELRKAAGRESESFESIVPLVVPPELDTLRRLEEAGATGTVSYPFAYTIGPGATLDQKLDMLKGFGDRVIRKL